MDIIWDNDNYTTDVVAILFQDDNSSDSKQEDKAEEQEETPHV
jgi:hypothetical protein